MTHWTYRNWGRAFLAPISIVAFYPGSGYTAEYLTVAEAKEVCFPAASAFEEAHLLFTAEQISQIEEATEQSLSIKGQQLWKVFNKEELLGYFVLDYVIGKHMTIDYAIAINPDLTVKQIEILQYRENYGDEIREKSWLEQFVGKSNSSELRVGSDIKNISGATISSKNVTAGVKRVLTTLSVVKP